MPDRSALFTVTFLAMTLLAFLPLDRLDAQARLPRPQVDFSGYTWEIRVTDEPQGPLDNHFGGRDISVFTEPDGALKLTVAYKEGIWYASEVFLRKRLGYGTYLFRLETNMVQLDRNLVLGLFTYSNSSAYAHREIDIEFSSWGVRAEAPKGQFVVQPSGREGNMILFPLNRLDDKATYSFEWKSDRIEFAAWNGHGTRPPADDRALAASWTFSDVKAIPKPGNEGVHINLYLAKGGPSPFGTGTSSVIIRSFEFKPAKK